MTAIGVGSTVDNKSLKLGPPPFIINIFFYYQDVTTRLYHLPRIGNSEASATAGEASLQNKQLAVLNRSTNNYTSAAF